jgi:transposase
MAAPYAQDLRDRILAAYDRGMQTQEIAKTFCVSSPWARRVKQARREQGRTTSLPMGGLRVLKIDLKRLRELVDQQPDATIPELHERLGIQCSESAVGMALSRLGLTFKKRRSMPVSRTGRMLPSSAHSGGRTSPKSRRGG